MTPTTDVVDTIRLEPAAGLVKSLGSHYSLESALADLVDNCVDAKASHVSVRLLTADDKLVQVEVVDDGTGMAPDMADAAMTLGYQRAYSPNDLGHYGVGLKAASFSHADTLTLWSSNRDDTPVGRRIRRADFSRDFACERLTTRSATIERNKRRKQTGSVAGTTIVWSDLRSSYHGSNTEEARTWISQAELRIRSHLGVAFHRLISSGALTLSILVDDIDRADDAIGLPVRAVDPFGYAQSGNPDYPKTLTARVGSQSVALQCHIWPGKADIPGFRISGKAGDAFQGFYVYRNDRLLQVGGWSEVVNTSKQRQLARILIEGSEAIGSLLTMNPEKAGLRFEPPFRQALVKSTASDGTTFDEYLEAAESTYKEAHRKVSKRHPIIAPKRGFSPDLFRAVQAEAGVRRSGSVSVRWTRLPSGGLFDIDFPNKEILLNRKYRSLLAPGGGSLNDAPLIKTLIFLLTHDIFEGLALGSKDKDNIALWRAVLTSAAETELRMRNAKNG
ncbi:ATP-binding protein [Rhodococcoides corynebacterioides]|uniref:ATP-binding protein n=1 Tax=Rhodococcoides corynebacterioides TaxID=53972 RepID=UPI001C9B300A|nr:ATP-binding protein [Rhodococcus corynebacterioides]MBY6363256.1 ATP-binding protein [Rhodococcus corynebacterioides]